MNFSSIMYVTYLLLSNISISYAEYWLKYILQVDYWDGKEGLLRLLSLLRPWSGVLTAIRWWHYSIINICRQATITLGSWNLVFTIGIYLCCEGDYIILWTVILKNLIIAKMNTSFNTIGITCVVKVITSYYELLFWRI